MGPNNPWSPQWRPDPTGRRLAGIRTARRGALLAAVAYVPLAAAAIATSQLPRDVELLVLAIGSPGVALLGAGLDRSEVRRVGKECRFRMSPSH